jgi:hypothetical protein
MFSQTDRLDPAQRDSISETLSSVIDDARVEQCPVAYVRETKGFGFHSLGLNIGRYEPIFGTLESDRLLPDGLIDFIIKSGAREIRLAGFAEWAQFEKIKSVLSRAGLEANIEAAALTPD